MKKTKILQQGLYLIIGIIMIFLIMKQAIAENKEDTLNEHNFCLEKGYISGHNEYSGFVFLGLKVSHTIRSDLRDYIIYNCVKKVPCNDWRSKISYCWEVDKFEVVKK